MNETSGKALKSVYAIVTELIIAQLEKGVIPWKKPWTTAGPPRNAINNTPYRGINMLLLNSLEYEHNLFLTWDQLKKAGASVLRGQQGHVIVFWKLIEKQVDGEDQPRKMQYLRYHKVFNIAQCSNLPKEIIDKAVIQEKPNDPIALCEQVVKQMPDAPQINQKGKEAFYNPATDVIEVPPIKRFTNSASFYGVLFHELVHSTGHQKRLNRFEENGNPLMKKDSYSFEELVAEVGSCFLQSHCGVFSQGQVGNNAAYINAWMQNLKNDQKLIVSAAVHGQKAADFILNTKRT